MGILLELPTIFPSTTWNRILTNKEGNLILYSSKIPKIKALKMYKSFSRFARGNEKTSLMA